MKEVITVLQDLEPFQLCPQPCVRPELRALTQAAPPYSGSRAGTVGSQQTGDKRGGRGRGSSTGLGAELPTPRQCPDVLPSGTSPGSQLLLRVLSPGSGPQHQVRGSPWDHPRSQEGSGTAGAAELRL